MDSTYDELTVNGDVPEIVEADPFEDEITNEIVLLDVMRLSPEDIELL